MSPDRVVLNERYRSIRSRGTRFRASGVAKLYRHRPPYSDEVVELLEGLLQNGPRRVLDAGTGPGKLARELVAHGFHVDASAEMIRVGKALPHGDHPALRWIHGPIEQVSLPGGYGLAVAGRASTGSMRRE